MEHTARMIEREMQESSRAIAKADTTWEFWT
jgi:hypothetical protein